jgi:CHAT domain-containing protein
LRGEKMGNRKLRVMVKFYQNMLEKNMDKVEALRQAKLELLKNQNYRSPLYWSAFVMYGE